VGLGGLLSPSKGTLAQSSLAGSSLRLSSTNLLFVALGTLQVLTVGTVLGTSRSYEIFLLAWMVPEWCLFGLGNVMQMFLTPGLLGIASRQGRGELAAAIWSVSVVVAAGLAGTSGLGWLLARPILGLAAPGLEGAELELGVRVFRFLMLTAFALGLVKLLGSLHRAGHSLVIVSLAQSATPMAVIGLLLLAPQLGPWTLALGFTAGAVAQLALLLPAPLAWGDLRPRWELYHPIVRELARSALPLLLATNGFRLVVLLDRAVASDLQPGDVAVLRYAFFFLMVVQGLVVMPLLSVGYNRLSTLAATGGRGAVDVVLLLLGAVWLLVLPLAAIQVVFAHPLVELVLGRQAFGPEAVTRTAQTLTAYALTLPFAAGCLVAIQAFLSRRRYGFVCALALTFPAAGLGLNLGFGSRWGVWGVALATAVTMAAWLVALLLRLLPEADPVARRRLLSLLWRALLATALAVCVLRAGEGLLPAPSAPRLFVGAGSLLTLYSLSLWALARSQLLLTWRELAGTRVGQ